jgi:hypothetical protein
VRPLAERVPDSLTAVQLNWIVMQVVIVVLVLAGMIIAATKLWL